MSKEKAEILIVDDEVQIQDMLRRFLEMKNFKCCTSSSASEALSLIIANGNIKLVLLDINMPVTNGIELLEKIREITSEIDVIMITGYEDMDAAEKAMELGARDYITKPFDFSYLETSILAGLIPKT